MALRGFCYSGGRIEKEWAKGRNRSGRGGGGRNHGEGEIREVKPLQPLRHCFLQELCELYRREKRWLIHFPEVERQMPAPEVDQAVERHLEQTVARVLRLEQLLELMKVADRRGSRVMLPLLRDADDVLTAVTLSSKVKRAEAGRRRLSARRVADFFPVGCQN